MLTGVARPEAAWGSGRSQRRSRLDQGALSTRRCAHPYSQLVPKGHLHMCGSHTGTHTCRLTAHTRARVHVPAHEPTYTCLHTQRLQEELPTCPAACTRPHVHTRTHRRSLGAAGMDMLLRGSRLPATPGSQSRSPWGRASSEDARPKEMGARANHWGHGKGGGVSPKGQPCTQDSGD